MCRLASIGFALTLAGAVSSSARAQSVFDFSYSGSGVSASGTLIATPEGNGQYLITGVSGQRNGAAITGVIAPGAFAGNDNLLYYPAASQAQTLGLAGGTAYLDLGGFSYSVGGLSFNLGWVNGSNGYTGIPLYGEAYGGGSSSEVQAISSFNVSPAVGAPGPIPGGGLLSGAFLCLGVARNLWRRRAGAGRR